MAFTGPVVLKVVRVTGASFSGYTMDQFLSVEGIAKYDRANLVPFSLHRPLPLTWELNAATELGLLVVESFDDNDREVDGTRLSQLKRIAEAMTPGVEMFEFLKRAIRWTRHADAEEAYELKLIMARSAVATGNLGEAARYFAVSRKPKEYAQMMLQWSAKGYPGERDLFLCRAVLHMLSASTRGADDAAELFDACAAGILESADPRGSDGAAEHAVVESPLCHFTRFVVELCQVRHLVGTPSREMVQAFDKLREVYGPSLDRGPHLDDILNRIGEVHLGIKPPPVGGLMGMLGELMGGM